jgi:hypothetical protein
LKQLEEVVGNTLELISLGSNFLNRTKKAEHLKERMNKSFCTAKEIVTGINRLLTGFEKIFASYSFHKGLI